MTSDADSTTVPCSACRGTGSVISRLGGEAHEVTCPWCDGSGRRLGPEHDAQARHRPDGDGAPEPPDQAA